MVTDTSLCSFVSAEGEECGRPRLTKGWCQTHYKMHLRGEMLRPIQRKSESWRRCEFGGCDRLNASGGLCRSHADQRDAGEHLRPVNRRPSCENCPHERNGRCEFDGCNKKSRRHGLCPAHATQKARGQTLRPVVRIPAGSQTKAEMVRRYNEARRTRLANADRFRVLEREWSRLQQRFDFRCAYCGDQEATERDHIIPLRRGGSHGIGNLLPVCSFCNRSKQARLLSEWKRRPVGGVRYAY